MPHLLLYCRRRKAQILLLLLMLLLIVLLLQLGGMRMHRWTVPLDRRRPLKAALWSAQLRNLPLLLRHMQRRLGRRLLITDH